MDLTAAELIAQAEALSDNASLSFWNAQRLLAALRHQQLRRPDLVMRHGIALLREERRLGDEVWTVLEQVANAALDRNDITTAERSLQKLQLKFPGSMRVRLLEGLIQEAKGEWGNASKTYGSIVEEKPSNLAARKRQVALLVGQGKLTEAVKALNGVIDIFQGDVESWLELAHLNLRLGQLDQAAFCYEELVLLKPLDALTHTHLAEIYYTLSSSSKGGGGGNSNSSSSSSSSSTVSVGGGAAGGRASSSASLLRARKHFSHSLTLQEQGNTRAMHGLCAACTALAATPGGLKELGKDEHELEVNAALHKRATTLLQRAYKSAPKGLPEILKEVSLAQSSWIEK